MLDPETVSVSVFKDGAPRQWEREKSVRAVHLPTGTVVTVSGVNTSKATQEALEQLEARVAARNLTDVKPLGEGRDQGPGSVLSAPS